MVQASPTPQEEAGALSGGEALLRAGGSSRTWHWPGVGGCGGDVPPGPPLPSSRVQWGDHRLGRRGALPQLAGALWPWAGLHLGRARGGGQAHHAGRPSVSALRAQPSQLLSSGDISCPVHPGVPRPALPDTPPLQAAHRPW